MEPIQYLFGKCFLSISLRILAVLYEGVPILEIFGRRRGSASLLEVLFLPYKYPSLWSPTSFDSLSSLMDNLEASIKLFSFFSLGFQ